jgi:hypothetical protein
MARRWFERLRAPEREPAAVRDDAELHARARKAQAQLADGRKAEAMAGYLAVFARDPGLLVELGAELEPVAAELGGDVWLEFRLLGLRAGLEGAADDADWVREAYGELLEEYRGDPIRLARIRAVGRLIGAAESRGDLPRALVRRAPR